jgi:hypothetical protein
MYTLLSKLPDAITNARQSIEQSQDYQKQRHDIRTRLTIPLKIGDKVWLERKQHSHKFAPKWLGPFYIHDVLHNGAYRLRRITNGETLPNTYHGSRLKIYLEHKPLEPVVIIE